MSEATEGRWCPRCGGELSIKRMMKHRFITTFLLCVFCRWKAPTLRYDMRTGEHEELLAR